MMALYQHLGSYQLQSGMLQAHFYVSTVYSACLSMTADSHLDNYSDHYLAASGTHVRWLCLSETYHSIVNRGDSVQHSFFVWICHVPRRRAVRTIAGEADIRDTPVVKLRPQYSTPYPLSVYSSNAGTIVGLRDSAWASRVRNCRVHHCGRHRRL